MNILLVEDDFIAAMAAEELLKNDNCQVDIAKTGKNAIQLADEKKYDLILMDIGLPDISGFETTTKIKQSRNQKTPIIALTGNAQTDIQEQSYQAGMTGFIEKPLNKKKLTTIFSRLYPQKSLTAVTR